MDYDGKTGKTRIESMRVGKVLEWYPDDVRLEVYNDRTGRKEEITMPKTQVALVENPFYAVMNEPNGTVQRLIRKLNLMDVIDEQVGSGKLDLIIQLPYHDATQLGECSAGTGTVLTGNHGDCSGSTAAAACQTACHHAQCCNCCRDLCHFFHNA